VTHKSSSSFDVAWIEVSFSTGGGTFEPAGFDPPSLAYAIAPVPNIVPSALGVSWYSTFKGFECTGTRSIC